MTASEAPEHSDEDLLAILAQDLDLGLRIALRERFPAIHGLLRRRFGDRLGPEIEDAMSFAACQLAKKFAEFDPTLGTLRAWLFRIARNRIIDSVRAAGRVESWPSEVLDQSPHRALRVVGSEDPESASDPGLAQALHELIDELPRLQRQVVRADFRAGGTADAKDLAADLGTSPNAVYVARHRAHKRLANALRERGYEQ